MDCLLSNFSIMVLPVVPSTCFRLTCYFGLESSVKEFTHAECRNIGGKQHVSNGLLPEIAPLSTPTTAVLNLDLWQAWFDRLPSQPAYNKNHSSPQRSASLPSSVISSMSFPRPAPWQPTSDSRHLYLPASRIASRMDSPPL